MYNLSVASSVTRLDELLNFGQLKPLATINLPKSLTFLGNFCKGVKIYHFSSKNIYGATFIDIWRLFPVTVVASASFCDIQGTYGCGKYVLEYYSLMTSAPL